MNQLHKCNVVRPVVYEVMRYTPVRRTRSGITAYRRLEHDAGKFCEKQLNANDVLMTFAPKPNTECTAE